jgi:hypothetical protein
MTKNKALNQLMNREAFLNASKLRTKEVEIPDVGTVLVRELSAKERMAYLTYMELDKDNRPQFSIEKQVNFNKFILSLSVINNDVAGSRMFASAEDVPDMRQDVTETIVKAVLQLSGILAVETPLVETPKETSTTP